MPTSGNKLVVKGEPKGVSKEESKIATFFDPLLECLVLITQIKHCPYSAEALKAGLPLEDYRFTPDVFIRAAERAGLTCQVVERPLKKISPLVLPSVLLLKNGNACILTRINKDGGAEIILPEAGAGVTYTTLQELNDQYTGLAIFIQMQQEFEDRAEEKSDAPTASWFWGTLWRFKKYYFHVVAASLLINTFMIVTPLFTMNVYNRVVPDNGIATLWVLAIGVMIVAVFDFVMRTLRGYFIDLAGKKIDVIIASRLFQQVMGVKMHARPVSTGVQANHLRDFETIRDFFTSATIASIVDLPFIFLFIWVIALIGGWLAIIPIIAVVIVIIAGALLSIPLSRAIQKSFTGGSQKHAILVESLHNLDVIKSVSAEGTMLGRWERYVGITAEAGLVSRFYSSLAINITIFMNYFVSIGVIVMGVYMIEDHELKVGDLIACTMLAGRGLSPLSQMASLLTRYQLTKFSFAALGAIMDLPLERPLRHKFLHRPKFRGAVEFDDVHFHYPGQTVEVFRGISFKIEAGEKVGILGSMGAGKTTLQKLMMCFYSPNSGAIRIDGTDIEQIDPADLRRHIGYVQQEPKLFFGSVRDNIAIKAPWAPDSEVLACAQMAGADAFIQRHPSGYDMPIGEGGHGISGGQAQAITIARALMLSPTILLFDEPTSSMDNSAEQFFLDNMKKFGADKTLLLVTHRMPLLALVDRLIVLQGGKIIADGSKDRVLDALRQLNKYST